MALSYDFDQISLQRMQGIDQKLMTVAMRAIKIAKSKPGECSMVIPDMGGARTDEEQNALFKKGVSKADGYIKKSFHQKSKYVDGITKALDVLPYVEVEGKKGNRIYTSDITDAQRDHYFNYVATCMLQAASELRVKLQWGGNWKFVDKPHYQMS